MITQGNILLANGTSAQIQTSARPNMFVHNSTDKSLVYSPDGVALYRYDSRDVVNTAIADALANQSDQSLYTSSTVQFTAIKIGDSANVGSLGNTNWLRIAKFANTGSGTPSKFHVRLFGGDWADSAYSDYLFTSHGLSSSASTLRIRRTGIGWKHGSSEIYYKPEWVCLLHPTNGFEVYVRLAGVDYCLLGPDVTQQLGGTGVFKNYIESFSSLPSVGYTQNPVIVDEQPVRQVSDALFLRNTSISRDSEFQYTDTSAVCQIWFDGNKVIIPERVYFKGSTSAECSICIPQGIAPTSPNQGDIWFDGSYLSLQNSGGTRYLTHTQGLSANYIPKALGTGVLSNSSIIDDGATVKIPNLSATSLVVGNIDNTEFNWLNGTSANIQSQLATLSATKQANTVIAQNQVAIGGTNLVSGSSNLTFDGVSLGLGVSAAIANPKITMTHNSGVSGGPELRIGSGAGATSDENSAKLYLGSSRIIHTTEPHIKFQRYNGTTSAYETMFQTDFTGTASKDIRFNGSVIVSGYSGNKALISNGSKVITESSVTSTQLGYLSTTSADVQTQVSKLSATRPTFSNGASNRIATFSTSTNLNGEANLTWNGTTFSPSSLSYVRVLLDGATANNGLDLKSEGANKWFIGERDSSTFAVYDYSTSNYDVNITSGDTGLITLGSATKKLNLPSLNTSAVVVTDGSRNLVSSNITTTQLGYLSTTSANVQTQLNTIGASIPTLSAFNGNLAIGTFPTSGKDVTLYTIAANEFFNNTGGRIRIALRPTSSYLGVNYKMMIGTTELFTVSGGYNENIFIDASIGGGGGGFVTGQVSVGAYAVPVTVAKTYNFGVSPGDFQTALPIKFTLTGLGAGSADVQLQSLIVEKFR